MRGIAAATGSHLCGFQNLLMRIPIRNTTKSPSISAVHRSALTSAMVVIPSVLVVRVLVVQGSHA
jgi:hypothetical protein